VSPYRPRPTQFRRQSLTGPRLSPPGSAPGALTDTPIVFTRGCRRPKECVVAVSVDVRTEISGIDRFALSIGRAKGNPGVGIDCRVLGNW